MELMEGTNARILVFYKSRILESNANQKNILKSTKKPIEKSIGLNTR